MKFLTARAGGEKVVGYFIFQIRSIVEHVLDLQLSLWVGSPNKTPEKVIWIKYFSENNITTTSKRG